MIRLLKMNTLSLDAVRSLNLGFRRCDELKSWYSAAQYRNVSDGRGQSVSARA